MYMTEFLKNDYVLKVSDKLDFLILLYMHSIPTCILVVFLLLEKPVV